LKTFKWFILSFFVLVKHAHVKWDGYQDRADNPRYISTPDIEQRKTTPVPQGPVLERLPDHCHSVEPHRGINRGVAREAQSTRARLRRKVQYTLQKSKEQIKGATIECHNTLQL
jgi:hypothetical protein